jgi:SAM-dependent methyltransferase
LITVIVDGMADEIFEDPRLAALYDAFEAPRDDLDEYVAIVEKLGARRVLDIGCGTGTFALLIAQRGLDVIGVDPARASLDVARAKPDAGRVRWIDGDATALPSVSVDLVTMTGNTAQSITDADEWELTLRRVHDALRPGGYLVFETRDPSHHPWQQEWTKTESHEISVIEGVGAVERWVELLDVNKPLVTFRWTWVFASDGQMLTSDSTLRFRERTEIAETLARNGFVVDEVRDAPDRPGRELVFFARKRAG